MSSGLQRDVNCLGDPEKITRKKALERVSQRLGSAEAAADLDALVKPVCKCIGDVSEKNRELSALFLTDALSSHKDALIPFLGDITRAIRERLAPVPQPEPSEEVRRCLYEVLSTMVKKVPGEIAVYMEDIAACLERGAVDAYPDVKKMACSTMVAVAKHDRSLIVPYAQLLVRSSLIALGHQQAKVRQTALQAIAAMVVCHPHDTSASGAGGLVHEVLPTLQALTRDRTATVREELLTLAAYWVGELDASEGKWMLPILLAGVADDMPGVAATSLKMLEAAGAADTQRMASMEISSEGAGGDADTNMNEAWAQGASPKLEPPFDVRSNGAKQLVQRHLKEMLPPMIHELGEWTVGHRAKAAETIASTIAFAEFAIAPHAETLLSALTKAYGDDDAAVKALVKRACTVTGAFVHPGTAISVCAAGSMQPTLTDSHRGCWLSVLATMLRGGAASRDEWGATFEGEMAAVAQLLRTPQISESEAIEVQVGVVDLASAVIEAGGSRCSVIADELFAIVLKLQSLSAMPSVSKAATNDVGPMLASALGDADVGAMFAKHSEALLLSTVEGHEKWDAGSHDMQLFSTLMRAGGAYVSTHVSKIIPVFVAAGIPERDPNVRMNALVLLKHLVSVPALVVALRPHASVLLGSCLMPSLIWRSGRVNVSIRKAAISVALSMFTADGGCMFDTPQIVSVWSKFMPLWTSCLDDEDAEIRFITCALSKPLFELLKGQLDTDTLRTMWIELLKRMDDSNDRIRCECGHAWSAYFPLLPRGYDSGQFDYLLRNLIVHVDDANDDVPSALMPALKVAAEVEPKQFIEILTEVKPKHRTPYRADELLQHAKTL